VTERPILFNGEMVRAILDGRKTQTRRPNGLQRINAAPGDWKTAVKVRDGTVIFWTGTRDGLEELTQRAYPNGRGFKPPCVVGDRLWVRETWMFDGADVRPEGTPRQVIYRASSPEYGRNYKWRPSIHMPRWASRITLEVTEVRAERVQDISEIEALAEGFCTGWKEYPERNQEAFARAWDSIYAKRGLGSDVNPWVWVITFARCKEVMA
jgi:hypothetical protein